MTERREAEEAAGYVMHSAVDHRLVDVLSAHAYVESGECVCSCGSPYKPHSVDTPYRQWIEHIRREMVDD